MFDEVDAGVGGAVAEVIGRAIADIAKHRQVLCITHLPQIAALATTHFVVDKAEARGRTPDATVRRLTKAERVDEIARMIGGIKVGGAARRAAAEMRKESCRRRPAETRRGASALASRSSGDEERRDVLAVLQRHAPGT